MDTNTSSSTAHERATAEREAFIKRVSQPDYVGRVTRLAWVADDGTDDDSERLAHVSVCGEVEPLHMIVPVIRESPRTVTVHVDGEARTVPAATVVTYRQVARPQYVGFISSAGVASFRYRSPADRVAGVAVSRDVTRAAPRTGCPHDSDDRGCTAPDLTRSETAIHHGTPALFPSACGTARSELVGVGPRTSYASPAGSVVDLAMYKTRETRDVRRAKTRVRKARQLGRTATEARGHCYGVTVRRIGVVVRADGVIACGDLRTLPIASRAVSPVARVVAVVAPCTALTCPSPLTCAGGVVHREAVRSARNKRARAAETPAQSAERREREAARKRLARAERVGGRSR